MTGISGRLRGGQRSTRILIAISAVAALLAACSSTSREAGGSEAGGSEAGGIEAGGISPSAAIPSKTRFRVRGTGSAKCEAYFQANSWQHNICATWTNNAPTFVTPGSAPSITEKNLTFTKSTYDGIAIAHGITINGQGERVVNAAESSFGDSIWGAAVGSYSYFANMQWVLKSDDQSQRVSGQMQNNGNLHDPGEDSSCTGDLYLVCLADQPQRGITDGGKDLLTVGYRLLNAPVQVTIQNQTKATLKSKEGLQANSIFKSVNGTSESGQLSVIPDKNEAYFAGYRQLDRSSSIAFAYDWIDPDNGDITHHLTCDLQVQTEATELSKILTWPVKTEGSKCLDVPTSSTGSSSGLNPGHGTIDITGAVSWTSAIKFTITVRSD